MPSAGDTTKADIENIQKENKRLRTIMIGVVIALFIGFSVMLLALGALMWNAQIWTASIYRGFIEELDEYNNKSEMLYKEVKIYNELKANPEIIEPKVIEPKVSE